ncbi:MAG: hypothetical protein IJY07_03425, partial [Clostridia bacterium]|nr:hypothetical protein [Clostridia bacterium]
LTMLLTVSMFSSVVANASTEIVVDSITKINADGEVINYDDTYSRDITINYTFTTATRYVIRVYTKDGGAYQYIRATTNQNVIEGKGKNTVIDEGELRIDCVAKDSTSAEIATISTFVKSDVTAPTKPTIDPDGVLEQIHSEPFSVAYIVGYDNLSGVDFTRSTYRFESLDGEVIISDTKVNAGYDKALIGGINQNGKIIFTIYDNAGNFIIAEESYTLYYFVDSTAPTITVTPDDEYSRNVMVSISWPIGVNYCAYRLVVNTSELAKKTYTAPFSIEEEGSVEVRAYYFSDGVETYVSKVINNIDRTPPVASTMEESVRTKVDLMSNTPVTLSLRAKDAESGIKRVDLKSYGYEFSLTDINIYSIDVTPWLGTNIILVAEDVAGNKTEFSYPLTGFDKNKIQQYSEAFLSLDQSTYDSYGWQEVINAYNRLSNLMGSQDSSSGTIAQYSKELDDAIAGNHQVKVTVSEMIDGLLNDFKAEIEVGATSVKRGGKLNLNVKKIDVSEAEFNEKMTIAATIAKFPAYNGYGFNLSLTGADGSAVTVLNRYTVSLTIPDSTKLAKVYYENNGILTQLSSTINNGVITFSVEGDGNFYFIVEKEPVVEQGKGLMIGDKFYSLELLLITGGIILGAIILVGVLTPLIYKIVKDKKLGRKKFNYLK